MLAASIPENQLTSIFSQLSFSSELKNYRMYLVVFLFDKYDNDVASNSEALLQAEPLIIYNDSLYKVIDFVFNNKSRIEVDNTIYSLVETKYSDVQTYSPDAKSNTKEVLNMDEVFHKVLLFNYKRETES